MFLALILLPLKDTFIEGKNGFAKLGLLILGLSFILTIGPAPGSFEGFIYTKIPFMYQLLGYPEAILYVLIFISILWISYKKQKRILDITGIFVVILICIMSIIGYFFAV